MRWIERQQGLKHTIDTLHEGLNKDPEKEVPYWLSQLLVARNVETYEQARDYFVPSLEQLHDPFLMQDMEKAVERIESALKNHESILVYGDYDVDGTTAVSLVYDYLNTRKASCSYYIPDRYAEGYGLSEQGINYAEDNAITLIITLDCGVKAYREIALANEREIDVIVCDHHLPEQELPAAYAVLDPLREDCSYPFKGLCGCGVGFKLVQALELRQGRTAEQLKHYLDLVAIAIGADVVSVAGENRILAYHGVKRIKEHPRPAFEALLQYKSDRHSNLTDYNFSIAPKINAAGRIKHGEYAVAFLTANDMAAATELAQEIERFNTERRATEKEVTEEALAFITDEEHCAATVVRAPHWHKGVIGIVASRLQATYYRPTIVFTQSGDHWAASARSVKGYDIHKAIDACKEHVIQFGGHAFAAGITLHDHQFEAFKSAFEAHVQHTLTSEQLEPSVSYDLEVRSNDLTLKAYRLIQRLQPFGPQNPEPVFLLRAVRLTGVQCVGAEKNHLRGQIGELPFIGFKLGDRKEMAATETVDVLATLNMNTFRESENLQLQLKDLRLAV
jgi:single-stranded-DNA-specific exonuclease